MIEKPVKLLEKYKQGLATEEETDLLRGWFHIHNAAEPNKLTEQELLAAKEAFTLQFKQVRQKEKRYVLYRGIAAAAVLIIALTAGLLWIGNNANHTQEVEKYSSSIVPGTNNAFLVLAGGQRIDLSEAASGKVAEQHGVRVSKTADGRLAYEALDMAGANEDAFHKIETPMGGQYIVKLSDGSSVTLNAASSIEFPASFKGRSTRDVTLTGEAYFQVAHDKAHPFVVRASNQQVRVLGTEFNINAYTDEPAVRTALLQGSVEVKSDLTKATRTLSPGQQSVLTEAALKVEKADIEAATSWKNGLFVFNNEQLSSIMRKISRWYNVTVKYEDPRLATEEFWGSVSRSDQIAEILNTLESTGQVSFKIKGNQITVLPHVSK